MDEPPLDIENAPDFEDAPELAPGAGLGPFVIEALLGRGGMSTVYRAYEESLDRVVALKVLPTSLLHDPTFSRRFALEVRVVAQLEHPNIVPVYASGIENGVPWMSMRLMPGGNVQALMRTPLPRGEATRILAGVGAALDYAHAHGAVHRDVKPSNILLDESGHVCLGDFGLARLGEGSSEHSHSGVVAGTPHYMAPEQGLGQKVDGRTDVYSLGIVAYEMFVGQVPFDADSPLAVLMQHVTTQLPEPVRGTVSPPVMSAIKRALAKDPAERWPTAGAFTSALEAALTPIPPKAPARWMAAAAAATVVVIVGLAIASWIPSQVPLSIQAPAQVRPVTAPNPSPVSLPPQPAQPEVTPALAPAPPAGGAGTNVFPVPDAAAIPPAAPVMNDVTPDALDAPGLDTPMGAESATGPALDPSPTPGPTLPTTAADSLEPEPPETTSAVSPNVVEPALLQEIEPAYPPLARAAGLEGDVTLEAHIDADGRVTDVLLLRSVHPLLDSAAEAAVRGFVYEPGRRDGVPTSMPVQITVSFRLE